MIQLFDTHRLFYRNAKLRAWDLATRSTRVNFQDYSSENGQWVDVGTDVITDESGYLFYANGTQKIECLGVAEAAIVDVSLDGGHSYLIQFVIQPDHDPSALHAEDIYGLSYTDENGNPATYNPAQGPKQLPDYLRRSEFSKGDWREGTILTEESDIDGAAIAVSKFAHLILIGAGRDDGSGVITFDLPEDRTFRAGQVVTIHSYYDITVKFNTRASSQFQLESDHTYIVHNYRNNHRVTLIDVTRWSAAEITALTTVPWAAMSYSPNWHDDGGYSWTATSIANNRIKEAIRLVFDAPAGIVSTHVNDITLKLRIDPFKIDRLPIIIYNTTAITAGAGTIELKFWVEVYDSANNKIGEFQLYNNSRAAWNANEVLAIVYVQILQQDGWPTFAIVNSTYREL